MVRTNTGNNCMLLSKNAQWFWLSTVLQVWWLWELKLMESKSSESVEWTDDYEYEWEFNLYEDYVNGDLRLL